MNDVVESGGRTNGKTHLLRQLADLGRRFEEQAEVLRDREDELDELRVKVRASTITRSAVLDALVLRRLKCDICGEPGGFGGLALGVMDASVNDHELAHRNCWRRDPDASEWTAL